MLTTLFLVLRAAGAYRAPPLSSSPLRRTSPPQSLSLSAEPRLSSSPPSAHRRRLLLVLLVAFGWLPDRAKSACMPSDDRPECIGVYKEWSEAITQRDAEAAGIRWMPREPEPATYQEAVRALQAQRDIVATFERRILSDNQDDSSLVGIGSELLRLRPRVTLAARQLRRRASAPLAPLFDAAVERTLFALDALDVAIGYAVRSDDPSRAFAHKLDVVDALLKAETECETLLRFANDASGFV